MAISSKELLINKIYHLGQKNGNGNFDEISLGTNVKSNEEVGIKLERTKTKDPQLLHESKVYKRLQGENEIPNIKWFGKKEDYNVLVIDLLGPNLANTAIENFP